MANKKSLGFVLERDQKEILDELTNEEAGIIFKAIYEYEATKKTPKLEKALKIVFKQFKVKLDFYDEKYNEKCKKNKENIQNYWDKVKNTTEYDRIQPNTVDTNKRKEKKIKKNKSKIKESERELSHHQTTPALADIISFCQENDMKEFDCEYFFEYYEDNNWLDGKGNKIKNWKAKVKKWYNEDVKDGKIKKLPEWFGKEIKQKEVEWTDEERREYEEFEKELQSLSQK